MPALMARAMLRLGLLARITVVGRTSGLERQALINKAAAPSGGYCVAAGDASHQWARNLRAAGRCRLRVKDIEHEYVATELDGGERDAAARALAPPLARGSVSPRGPVFRLDPSDETVTIGGR